jgi:hypothetical protein
MKIKERNWKRTYKGNKDKDNVKNKSLCCVVDEISNGTRENNDGNSNNVEKKLKGENRVNFPNEILVEGSHAS